VRHRGCKAGSDHEGPGDESLPWRRWDCHKKLKSPDDPKGYDPSQSRNDTD
jgi:hypothetical protein